MFDALLISTVFIASSSIVLVIPQPNLYRITISQLLFIPEKRCLSLLLGLKLAQQLVLTVCRHLFYCMAL